MQTSIIYETPISYDMQMYHNCMSHYNRIYPKVMMIMFCGWWGYESQRSSRWRGQCSPKSGFDRKRSAHWVVVQCSCTVVHLCRLKQIRSGQHISLSSEQLSMFVQCVQCVQYMLFILSGWVGVPNWSWVLYATFKLFTFHFYFFTF